MPSVPSRPIHFPSRIRLRVTGFLAGRSGRAASELRRLRLAEAGGGGAGVSPLWLRSAERRVRGGVLNEERSWRTCWLHSSVFRRTFCSSSADGLRRTADSGAGARGATDAAPAGGAERRRAGRPGAARVSVSLSSPAGGGTRRAPQPELDTSLICKSLRSDGGAGRLADMAANSGRGAVAAADGGTRGGGGGGAATGAVMGCGHERRLTSAGFSAPTGLNTL